MSPSLYRTNIHVSLGELKAWWRERTQKKPDQILTPEAREFTTYLEKGQTHIWTLQTAHVDSKPASKKYPIEDYNQSTKLNMGIVEKIIGYFPGSVGATILQMQPQTKYYLHEDTPSKSKGYFRAHLAIETNEDCVFHIDGKDFFIPSDGYVYFLDTRSPHYADNRSRNQARVHLSWLLPGSCFESFKNVGETLIK